MFVETRMKAPADRSTSESTTKGRSHGNLAVRRSLNSELGLDLICLIGTAHLSTQSGCPKVERIGHGTSSGRRVERKAGAPLTALCL